MREIQEKRTMGRVAPVAHKTKLGEEGTDFAYWQSRPYQERLTALEDIRREYHTWRDGAHESRLQRVYRCVKRS